MALTINYDCIACAACVDDCPNEAISEGPGIYVIDPMCCTECVGYNDEPQCVTICPVDCIVPDPEHRETHDELMAKKDRVAAARTS
jgi:ferredoxin